jgi:proton-translocating NADH-quinone oxidoreductase chain N
MEAASALLWLLAFPFIAAPVVYIGGRLVVRESEKSEKTLLNPAGWLALLALLGTGAFLYIIGKDIFSVGQIIFATVGNIRLRFDGISLLMSILVLVLGILVTIYSFAYMKGEEHEEKFYALLVLMIGSIIGLSCAIDLFNLWVWFEAMAITTILLVAFYRNQPGSLEAGVKYLVQSAAGSVLVVLGIVLVFFQTGSLDLESIRMAVTQPNLLLVIAGGLMVIGFGVKIALVPMHTWLPDAHSQAPSGISAMLSGVVIEAGLIALLRAFGALAVGSNRWGYILIGFAVLNMVVGNLMALRQREVKRMLAYSSLSHVGYMLLGFGVMMAFYNPYAGMGGFYHLLTHGLMKGLAFLAAGALLYVLHVGKGDHHPLIVDDLNGASRKYPVTAFTLSVALLALGGLPPLAGFMSKWQIFASSAMTQNAWVIALVIFAALNSVLSLGYYAPLVNRLYRRETSPIVEAGKPVSIWMSIPMVVLTLLIVVLGVAPNLIYWLTGPSAISIFMFFGN